MPASLGAERVEQRGALGGVPLGGRVLRLLGGDRHELAGGQHGGPDGGQGAGQPQHVAPPDPGALVEGQPARDADMAAGRAGGERGDGRVDPVAADEQLGDVVHRGDAQPHVPAARADGHEDVVGTRGAQQPDGARRRLLDRLEQEVAARCR